MCLPGVNNAIVSSQINALSSPETQKPVSEGRQVSLGIAPTLPQDHQHEAPQVLQSKPRTVSEGPRVDKNKLNAMVSDASTTRQTSAGRNLTPQEANKLLNQVAIARQSIVALFVNEGKLEGMTHEQAETRTNELPLHQLSTEKRKLATDLMQMAGENLRVLNKTAEAVVPSERLFADNVRSAGIGDAKQKLESKLGNLIPDAFKDGFFRRNLKGDEASRQMHQLAWEFKSLIKNNPDVKFGLGGGLVFTDQKQRDAYLDKYVGQLRLNSGDKAKMKEMLTSALNETLPKSEDVSLSEILGEGSFGVAWDGSWQDKPVVVKVLKETDDRATLDLIQEMTTQGQIQDDPNIPKVKGILFHEGQGVVVMEKVAGSNLDSFFKKNNDALSNPVDRAKVALHLFGGTARALGTMHEKGMIHRDIKPANAMIDTNTLEARLIDFGTSGRSDLDEDIGGSPAFFSPEHLSKHMPPAGDIFSLGSSLYQQMGGKLWQGVGSVWQIAEDLQTGKKPGNFNDTSIWTPQTQSVRNLIEACWGQDPNERPTAKQMAQALNGEAVTSAQPGEPGLKAGRISVLDVLKPGSALMSGAQDVLANLVEQQ
ncbi:MAG: protein kinase [Proteobacteria bacterium]|nr:protein kinase [Pseudomonadota bacterium]